MDSAALRLWQLISPTLPVGAYAYSGGLEAAVDRELVHDRESAGRWIAGLLRDGLAVTDLPMLRRLLAGWRDGDLAAVAQADARLTSLRDTAELRAQERQMGRALQTLLVDLEVEDARALDAPTFAAMYALAAVHWKIADDESLHGYAWSWCESQVAAAVKLVPLGQTEGQRLLGALMPEIGRAVERSAGLEESDVGRSLPGLAVLSACHETQYSRLFRS